MDQGRNLLDLNENKFHEKATYGQFRTAETGEEKKRVNIKVSEENKGVRSEWHCRAGLWFGISCGGIDQFQPCDSSWFLK